MHNHINKQTNMHLYIFKQSNFNAKTFISYLFLCNPVFFLAFLFANLNVQTTQEYNICAKDSQIVILIDRKIHKNIYIHTKDNKKIDGLKFLFQSFFSKPMKQLIVTLRNVGNLSNACYMFTIK